jgi:hypothetical protein
MNTYEKGKEKYNKHGVHIGYIHREVHENAIRVCSANKDIMQSDVKLILEALNGETEKTIKSLNVRIDNLSNRSDILTEENLKLKDENEQLKFVAKKETCIIPDHLEVTDQFKDSGHLYWDFIDTGWEVDQLIKFGWLKKKKKVIDLSVLINSIDCEFWNLGSKNIKIDKLVSISDDGLVFRPTNLHGTTYCQPRMDHWHSWSGGDCPLPEGFIVEARYRNGDTGKPQHGYWRLCHHQKDIIAFRITGRHEDYIYEWEKANN